MKLLSTILVAVSVSVLAGCSSTGGSKNTDVQIEDRSGSASGSDSGATTSGVQGYGGLGAQSLGDPNSPLSQRVIYFAYDSSKVEDEDRDLVAAHAAYLSANSDVKVSVEGHTDERGSREYNIALGDGRSQALRRMLEFHGVASGQITTVSFGEEKTAAQGHDETAYSLNRRVELVYVGY